MHLFFDLIPVVNALVSRLATLNFKKGKLYFNIHCKTNEEKPEKSEYKSSTRSGSECRQKQPSVEKEKN